MNPKTLLPSRRGWFAALFCTALVASSFLIGWLEPALPVSAVGPCKAPNASCGLDTTKTSVLEVNHATTSNPADPVLPDDSETWAITAYWADDGPGICDDVSETAYATVSWNGSGWTVSNVTLTTNITGIQICDAGSCSGSPYGVSPSRRYRLKVNITDPEAGAAFNLRNVVYTTTAVDDGLLVTNTSCGTGSSVSPTSQTFTQTDSGAFECSYDCTAITGPLVTITYN